MSNSLRCRIKKWCYQGIINEKDRDRLINGLDCADALKWIPVSERLPKATNYYLIQHTRKYCNDEMAVAFYSVEEAHVDPNYTWEFVTDSDVQEVIAWMPLPKPYEPQESEVEE